MELLDNAVGSHVRNPSFGNVVRQKFADANSPTRGTVSSVKLSRKNSTAKNSGPYSDASIYSIPSRAIPRNARKQIIVNEGRDPRIVQGPIRSGRPGISIPVRCNLRSLLVRGSLIKASDIYTDFMPQGFSDFPKPPEVSPSTSFTGKDKMVKPEVGQVKKPKRNKPIPNQTKPHQTEVTDPKPVAEVEIEPAVEKVESNEIVSQENILPTQTPTHKRKPAVRKAPEVPKRPPSDIIPKIPPPMQKIAPPTQPIKQPHQQPEIEPEVVRKPKVIEIPRPEMVKMGEPEVKSETKLQRAPSTKIRTKIVSTFEEMCLGLSSSEENLQAEDSKPVLASPSRENLISEETDLDCPDGPEMPAKMEPIMASGPFDSHVPEYISKPQIKNDSFQWEQEPFDIDPFETSDVFDNAIIQQMSPSRTAKVVTTEVAAEQFAEIKRYDSQNSMISDAKSLRRNSSDFRERALSMKTDRTFDITEVTKMDFKCNISLSTDKFSEEMIDEVAYEEIQTEPFEATWPQENSLNQNGQNWPENDQHFDLPTPPDPWPEMTIAPEPTWPAPPLEEEIILPRLNACRPNDNLDTASISTEELDRKIELMMRKREKRINDEFVQATRSFDRPVIVNEQFIKPVQIQPQPEQPDQVSLLTCKFSSYF